jgi:hypothetical protein
MMLFLKPESQSCSQTQPQENRLVLTSALFSRKSESFKPVQEQLLKKRKKHKALLPGQSFPQPKVHTELIKLG